MKRRQNALAFHSNFDKRTLFFCCPEHFESTKSQKYFHFNLIEKVNEKLSVMFSMFTTQLSQIQINQYLSVRIIYRWNQSVQVKFICWKFVIALFVQMSNSFNIACRMCILLNNSYGITSGLFSSGKKREKREHSQKSSPHRLTAIRLIEKSINLLSGFNHSIGSLFDGNSVCPYKCEYINTKTTTTTTAHWMISSIRHIHLSLGWCIKRMNEFNWIMSYIHRQQLHSQRQLNGNHITSSVFFFTRTIKKLRRFEKGKHC